MEDGVQLAWYCTICSTPFGGAEYGWAEWEPTVPEGWTTSAVVRPDFSDMAGHPRPGAGMKGSGK